MKKRLWSMLLVMAMCLTMLPVTALAAGNAEQTADSVASVTIGDTTTYYNDIFEAWSAAQGNTATVKILQNVDLGSSYLQVSNASSDITLEMADSVTLTSTASSSYGTIYITAGNFALVSGTVENTFQSIARNGKAICVQGGNVTISGGNVIATGIRYGVYIKGTCDVTITGDANIIGGFGGVVLSGTMNHKLTISGGTIRATNSLGLTVSNKQGVSLTGGTFSGVLVSKNTTVDNGTVGDLLAEGYGYYKQDDDSLITETSVNSLTDTVMVKPVSTRYTITFNANSGSVTPATAQTDEEGKLSEPPTPTRDGYEFLGWYTQETDGEQITTDTMFTENTTVYAHWRVSQPEAPTYDQLKDNSSDGTCINVTIKCISEQPEGGTQHFKSEATIKENTASVTSYDLSEVIWDETKQKWYCDVTVYAAPYIASYMNMAFLSGGGLHVLADGEPESKTVRFWYNSDKAAQNKNPWGTEDGYDGTQRKLEFQVVDGIIGYTITFNANDGSVTPATAQTDEEGKLSELPTPTRDGYEFLGWYTQATGGDKITIDAEFTENATVYAHWRVSQPEAPTYDQLKDNSSNGTCIDVRIKCITDNTPDNKTHNEYEITLLENTAGTNDSYVLSEVQWDETEQKWYCDVTVYAERHIASYNRQTQSGGWLHVLADDQLESSTVRFWYNPDKAAQNKNPWGTEDGYDGTQRNLEFEVVDVVIPRTITLQATEVTPISVSLEATVSIPTENDTVMYAMNTTGDTPEGSDWNIFSEFNKEYDNIQPGITYYFFAKVNANPSTGHTAAVSEPLKITTPAKAVSSIAVKTQPSKLEYASGDTLDLTGLTIEVSYNDGTTDTITDLATEGLTITPANGTNLTVADHNNQTIQISYGGKTCKTDALTVSQAEQEKLTITGVPEKIYSGDTFTLKTTGGSGDGAITWEVVSGNATIDENGKVTITGTGDIVVKAIKAGGTEYTSVETTVTFTAQKKPGVIVTPTYPPTITDTDNGDVTVSPSSPQQGDTVTITPKPDNGYAIDKVTVTDSNGKEITVKDNGNGTYSFTQPSGKVTITVTFKATGCPKDSTCPISKFTDASATAWYHDGVHYVLDEGLMFGIGDNKFAPNATLTRAELAQILYNKAGKPAVTGPSTFTDVPASAWYAKAIAWAQQNNVVSGIGGNQFAPNQIVTREQIAVMLYNDAGKPKVSGTITGFADAASVSTWAYDAVLWATQNDVVNGVLQSNGTRLLNPTSGATRAETAALLANFYQK